MCRPVRAKKVPPKSGTPQGFLNGVTPSLLIRFNHSDKCSTTNVPPPAIVARIQPVAALRLPLFIAATAITMVKLLESSAKVMMLEKIMLGEKWNGVGQSGLETRLYV